MGFTDSQARLTQKGAIGHAKGSRLSIEDEYVVTMANGVRPLGYDVRYKYRDGSAVRSGTISRNVTGIPGRNASHPDYPCFKVESITWRQPDPRSRVWYCTVRYEYDPAKSEWSALDNDIVSVTFGSVTVQQPIITGEDGASLRNSAGDPFDPVPMAEVQCPTVTIVRDESTEPADRAEYQGAINSAGVRICGIWFPKHCARVTWTAERLEDEEGDDDGEGGGTTHIGDRFRYTYSVEGNLTLRPNDGGDGDGEGGGGSRSGSGSGSGSGSSSEYAGWVQYIPDAGWNYIDAETGVKCRAKVHVDGEGDALEDNPQQVFLNGDGGVLEDGEPVRFIVANPYPVMSFSGLDFPR